MAMVTYYTYIDRKATKILENFITLTKKNSCLICINVLYCYIAIYGWMVG